MKRFAPTLTPLAAAGDLSLFGGKAAALSRMVRAGFAVPQGYVVSDIALQAHLAAIGQRSRAAGLAASLAKLDEDDALTRGASIASAVRAAAIEADLRASLRDLCAGAPSGTVFAVRSSAAGEDSTEHSFAGQLDSVLGVGDLPGLEDALRTVWASLWSARSLIYQRRRGARVGGMGVIVQHQVAAAWSGVLFSESPAMRSAAAPAMLIEYCSGLGDRLVCGELTPGRLQVGRVSKSVLTDEPSDDGPAPARARLIELVETAERLERLFGSALDIEWSIDESGAPWLLQARPITARQPATAPTVVWTNANIAENFPEPISPLLYSVVRSGYTAYFRNLGIGFGISRRRIAAMAGALERVVGVHGGRLYYNLSNIHALLWLAPGGRMLARFFNEFVGAQAFPQPADPLPHSGRLAQALELLRVAANTLWQYGLVGRRLREFEDRIDAFCAANRLDSLRAKSRSALLEALRGFTDIRLKRWNGAALCDTAAMVCYGLLSRLLARALPEAADENMHNRLLVGLPELASQIPVSKLWALSREVRDDRALAALFAGSGDEAILARLDAPAFEEFRERLDEYLENWGFRSSGELMLTRPSPQEAPIQTIAMLRSYASVDAPSPDDRLRTQAEERLLTTRRACRRLTPVALGWIPLFSRASRFRILLRATQGAIRLRERARQKQAKLYVCLRHVVLAIGRTLVRDGRLDAPEDAFLLTRQELDSLLAGSEMFPDALHELVRIRRAEHERLAAIGLPDSFELAQGAYWPAQASGASAEGAQRPAAVAAAGLAADRMNGIGACGGQIEAKAAVLADATEGARLTEPAIVVTRQTDPGWACVFFLARGLVIERGGMLSHGAIIAREFGIPAVVGVCDATRRIGTGDRLLVDGDRGVVQILR